MVQMVGVEPTRLAPPPPQDGVSTNSTTSAKLKAAHYSKKIPTCQPSYTVDCPKLEPLQQAEALMGMLSHLWRHHPDAA